MGISWLPDGHRPEDLSLGHSLTCKNTIILEYYRVGEHTQSVLPMVR